MKKIVFFIQSISKSGGIERVVSTLANIFVVHGFRVEIVVINKDITSYYPLEHSIKVISLGINEFSTVAGALKYYITATFEFRKYIKKHNPDFVMGIWTNRSIMAIMAAWNCRTKVICCEHIAYNRLRAGLRLIRPMFYKYADAVVSLTNSDVELYEKINHNVYVIGNPVEKDVIFQRERQKTVLAVGRLVPQKGFDILLKIWKDIYKDFSDWKLVIVGRSMDRYEDFAKGLREYINSNEISNQVEINDQTHDIYKYYAESSVYAMTSRFEGLPMVLLEAMQFSLPVVCFDCPTGPREIIVDNKTGYLVENSNISEYTKKLKILMSDENKRKEFGDNASLDINKRFSEQEVYRKWVRLFNDMSEEE